MAPYPISIRAWLHSTLLGGAPAVRKTDYARWMLDDPRVNFAISRQGRPAGVNRRELPVETVDELAGVTQTLRAVDRGMVEERDVNCQLLRAFAQVLAHRAGRHHMGTFHSLGEILLNGGDVAVHDDPSATRKPRRRAAPEARCTASQVPFAKRRGCARSNRVRSLHKPAVTDDQRLAGKRIRRE